MRSWTRWWPSRPGYREALLRRLAEAAASLAGARYGALGVIGQGVRLARFVPVGLTEEEILRIDHWPEGHGIWAARQAAGRGGHLR